MDNLNAEAEDISNESTAGGSNLQPVEWRQHIPSDMTEKGYWKPLEQADLSTVLKNYGHAQERLGRSITVPEENGDFGPVYEKLGRPKTAAEYQVESPEVNGVGWRDDSFEAFKSVAHAKGLTQNQLSGIVDWFKTDLSAQLASAEDTGREQAAVVEVKLKKELGPNYDMDVALAKRTGNLFFGLEATEEWFDTMPEPVVRGLLKLGKQMAEDKVFGNSPPEMNGITTKEQAMKRIAEIGGDRNHAYWSFGDTPLKQAAIQEMESLHYIAFPE